MSVHARWRLDHHGIHDVEVELRPSADVGELADALAQHVRRLPTGPPLGDDPTSHGARLTIESSLGVLDPRGRALDTVPPAGSTIRLRPAPTAPAGAAHEGSDPAARSHLAPVTISTAAGSTRLRYGHNLVNDAVGIAVGSEVLVTSEGSELLLLDGATVHGHAGLRDGSMIRHRDWVATLRIHGALKPPPPGGVATRIGVSRGEWVEHEPARIDLPTAPERYRPPGFPWLTAMVPMMMAAAMWVATRSLLMVGFMAFSFVYVVASGIETRREARKADRHKVEDFREDLAAAAGVLGKSRDDQERRDETRHPAAAEALGWIRPISHRLWERSGLHPAPLSVRLGTAPLHPDDLAVGRASGRPELAAEVAELLAHNEPRRRPLTIDLEQTGGIAIVGEQHMVTPLAEAIVAQLTLLTPPDRLSIALSVPAGHWQWARWLPHLAPGAELTLTVLQRHGRSNSQESGSPLLWLAPDTVGLPDELRALVKIDADGRASFQLDNSERLRFDFEAPSSGVLESAARKMAGLRSGAALSAGNLPGSVSLADLGLPLRADEMAKRWTEPHRRGIVTPLGLSDGGGVLTLDLVADGPHALIGGTTGSGKSELLRTMLAGMAATHSPEQVNLLLVDYKGGAAFGALAELPHCVGLVTDLGGSEVTRTLIALRSELHRRELILDEHGAGDLRELVPAVRPPSLVLVVDEFATLVAEVPDFLDGVLDVAQRGRSLGIHMILATQRPTGVVSDAVKANTSLRIALRLPDADDSTDVVGSADASELPRDIPGRALVRLGHDTLLLAQVAYSGGPVRRNDAVRVRPVDSPNPTERTGDGTSELAELVRAACAAKDALGLDDARRPVPPPLPERLSLAELLGRTDVGIGSDPLDPLPVGLRDRPQRQTQEPLLVDPAGNGGVLVVGGARSGASSTLVSLAAAADARGGWDIHAIATDRGLDPLAALGSVREVVEPGDHEAVRRLLDSLLGTSAKCPRLVLLDGIAAFEEQESSVNHGRAMALLIQLANEGRSRGVTVAVSARHRTQVPMALLNSLGERIVLRVVDEDQAAIMDAPGELADRTLPPGRGWSGGDWIQIAAPPNPPAGAVCPRPQNLAREVPLDSILSVGHGPTTEDGEHHGRLVVPIGISAAHLGVESIDLTTASAIVAGPPRSGRTSALATIRRSAAHAGITCVADTEPTAVLQALAEHAESPNCEAVIGFLDDFDEVAEEGELEALLKDVLRLGRRSPVRLVISGDPGRLARCYSDGLMRLRASRTGLLLGADGHDASELLHQNLRARDDVPQALGRGWLIDATGARIVQVAH